MSDTDEVKTIVNRAELASLFEVSLPTVDAWVRKGCPVVERGGRGREWKFHFSEVFNWRVLHEVTTRLVAAR
jgi:phage terminase Nu1 subunit (DNA packaging protein)